MHEHTSSSGPNPDERRREFRLNRFLGAELIQGEERRKARFYVINISRTGLKATNQFALEASEIQEFDLYLQPKQPPLSLKARIAWQKTLAASGTFELGFEFVEMSEENADKLEAFIESERHKPNPSKPTEPLPLWTFQA